MISFNHFAYGAVGDWSYQTLDGIRPCRESPNFDHIIIEPRPGGSITSATTSLDTPRGLVSCSWRLGDSLELDAVIPAASWATIRVPASELALLQINGEPVGESLIATAVIVTGGSLEILVNAGTYSIRTECA